MAKHSGVIDGYFETGTEGILWVFFEDGEGDKYGYRMIEIQKGDNLTIFSEDGSALFKGEIIQDREKGGVPLPGAPQYKQSVALGFWIHWTQEGWEPDDWAMLFLRSWFNKPAPLLRAELVLSLEREAEIEKGRKIMEEWQKK